MTCNAYYIFFRSLANPLKMRIVAKLKEKPMSVNELSEQLRVEQSKLSHALIHLKECRIVEVKQIGKQRIYSLNKETITEILKIIDKHKSKYCKGECCKRK